MNLINVVAKFKTEDECIDHLIAIRWPNGVCCIKCGEMNVQEMRIEASRRKNGRFIPARRLFRCLRPECKGYQFTAKAGTIFDASHLPLHKWFMAIGLIVEGKKGVSAKQIARHLGMEKSYKTVWYLCHRIREAMQESGFEFLTGTVEVGETYLTPRKPRKGEPKVKRQEEMVVLGMRQRGGPLRLIPIKAGRMAHIEPEIVKHISPDAMLQTDKAMTYDIIGKRLFVNHRMIDHIRTYGEGENHTNTVESAFSLLKRGVYGTFHKVSIKHLGRYCNEFSYRFNRREDQANLFNSTVKGLVRGKALRFKTLIEKTDPSDVSL
jgi:hypothetical protein